MPGLPGSSLLVSWLALGLQTAGEDLVNLERRMLELVNLEREARGLRPLAPLRALAEVARRHSRSMAEAGEASHEAGGQTLEQRIRGALDDACQSAENIGKHINVDYALADLLASPGHRANLLNPVFTGIGIGIARRGGFLFITQDFVRFCEKERSKPRQVRPDP